MSVFCLRSDVSVRIAEPRYILNDGADKGVLRDTYGADVRRGLDHALLKRWAVRTAAVRLQITDAGRAEWPLAGG